MLKLLISILTVLTLVSCNTQNVSPEYPMSILSVIKVQNEYVEYTADFKFVDGISLFVIREPAMLKGLKITVEKDELKVSYNDLELSYNNPMSVKFKAFKDLHGILIKLNELQPEFINNGEILCCDVEYNGEIVSVTADTQTQSLESLTVKDTIYDFD